MQNQITSALKPISLPRLAAYLIILFIGFFNFSAELFSGQYNGFNLDDGSLVPINEIYQGGPPKDGIPSIDNPIFVSASEAEFLQDDDRIIGVIIKGMAKAYPIRILNWHEIVNDDDTVISYCPLCGTGMAFESINADFGVSGLLYNSDMLLYDRKTESLWSQIAGKAISGKRKGEKVKLVIVENTSWKDWQNNYPSTHVLSESTGFSRNYSKSPYNGYDSTERLYFPVSHSSTRFHPKEKIIGLERNGIFKAYPFSELSKSEGNIIKDRVAGEAIEIYFNNQHRSGYIQLASGEKLPSLISFWFAWYAFHPNTDVYTSGTKQSSHE